MAVFIQLSAIQRKEHARVERVRRNEERHESSFPSRETKARLIAEVIATPVEGNDHAQAS